MPTHAQNISRFSLTLVSPISPLCKNLSPFRISSEGFNLSPSRRLHVLRSNGKWNGQFWWRNRRNAGFSALDESNFCSSKWNGKLEEHFSLQNSWSGMISSALNRWNAGVESAGAEFMRTREIVEHLYLLKAKADLTEDEERDMLDYLYTSQYQMSGIIAISLGRIIDLNADGFTHALYMRFQRKEDLAKFYDNVYSKLFKEHVLPYCHGWINVDYESEVEDDILPIFRKGEDFNYGIEFVLLISVIGSAIGGPVEDALGTFARLTKDFGSLIVQATQAEALDMFKNCSEYKMWRSKFQPITKKTLAVHFAVDPVGTEIM